MGLNANDSRRIVLGAYGEDFDYPRFRQETADWFKAYVEKKGLPIKSGAGDPRLLSTECKVTVKTAVVWGCHRCDVLVWMLGLPAV